MKTVELHFVWIFLYPHKYVQKMLNVCASVICPSICMKLYLSATGQFIGPEVSILDKRWGSYNVHGLSGQVHSSKEKASLSGMWQGLYVTKQNLHRVYIHTKILTRYIFLRKLLVASGVFLRILATIKFIVIVVYSRCNFSS